jgi:hypothetical protein
MQRNSHIQFINKISLFAAMLTAMFSIILGQETVPVCNSELVNAKLPANASRVTEANVPAEVNDALGKLIAEGGDKIRQGETEVLAWTNGFKRSNAPSLIKQITANLQNAGWDYEVGGENDGVTVFSATSNSAKRVVIGFYTFSDDTFVWAWTEMLRADQPRSNVDSGNTPTSGSGDVSDYSFTTPAGWSRSDSANKIVLTNGVENKIEFLPLMHSSGNLETDANRILWQVFKGCDSWYALGFEPDYGTFEKGKTAQGLEYFRAYRYAKNASEQDSTFATTQFDAIILLVKLNNRVAVISGRQRFQSDTAKDSALTAMDLILYDLTFKSVPNSYSLKNELLGSWGAASGSVALAYTFNANGSFNKGSAIGYRTSRDAQTDNLHTTSYGMTETYSLSGNILTQNYKRTREVFKYKIRVYQTKYDKQAWQPKLGFLPIDNPDSGTIVFRKSN